MLEIKQLMEGKYRFHFIKFLLKEKSIQNF